MMRYEQRQQTIKEAFQVIHTHPAAGRPWFEWYEQENAAGYVRLRREGKQVTGGHSRDGKTWVEFRSEKVEWKETVKVGVYATHWSDAPFEAVFDEYTLTLPKK